MGNGCSSAAGAESNQQPSSRPRTGQPVRTQPRVLRGSQRQLKDSESPRANSERGNSEKGKEDLNKKETPQPQQTLPPARTPTPPPVTARTESTQTPITVAAESQTQEQQPEKIETPVTVFKEEEWHEDFVTELNRQRQQHFDKSSPVHLHFDLCLLAQKEANRLKEQKVTALKTNTTTYEEENSKFKNSPCTMLTKITNIPSENDIKICLENLLNCFKSQNESTEAEIPPDSETNNQLNFWTKDGVVGCAKSSFHVDGEHYIVTVMAWNENNTDHTECKCTNNNNNNTETKITDNNATTDVNMTADTTENSDNTTIETSEKIVAGETEVINAAKPEVGEENNVKTTEVTDKITESEAVAPKNKTKEIADTTNTTGKEDKIDATTENVEEDNATKNTNKSEEPSNVESNPITGDSRTSQPKQTTESIDKNNTTEETNNPKPDASKSTAAVVEEVSKQEDTVTSQKIQM